MNKTPQMPICSKANSWVLIANALFWAAIILFVSKLEISVGSNGMVTTGILIACWFAVHSFIQGRK